MDYYVVKINENITMRGMNALFYEVEFKRVSNNKIHHSYYITYQRGNIENMLHGSSIWYQIKNINDTEAHLNYEDYIKYRDLLEETIKKLEEIETLTTRTLTKWH